MAKAALAETGMSPAEIETMRAVEDDLWWYRAFRGHVVASIHPPRAAFDLLDAGCGTGGMLARVGERFPEARLTGLDYSQRALDLTNLRNTGAALVHGRADALPFEAAQFDVVLSLDVLVLRGVDDAGAMREMHRVLRPDGMLILNLAAFDFLRGSHDAATNMARRYTKCRVASLLRAAGFRLERLSYWNMCLMPAIAAVRWFSRARADAGAVVRSDLKPIWRPLNAALTLLAKLELAISRHVPLPVGTSLFVVARK